MTPVETVTFVAACRAANPGWTPLDGTAELWHESSFRSLDADLAKAALMRLLAEHNPWWPNPADVLKAAAQIRTARQPKAIADDSFSRACPWAGCQCTHSDGCVKGWLDNEDGTTSPSPVCRWNRQQFPNEPRHVWLERLRTQNAAWAKDNG
jgi:hypothetical protein